MKIDHLHIQHFRCLEDYEVTFATGATVIIGKNGAGKSTLLTAICKSLSILFSKGKGRALGPSLSDGMPTLKVDGFHKGDEMYNVEIGNPYPDICIETTATISGEPMPIWRLYAKTNTFKLQDSEYRTAYDYFNQNIIASNRPLPILAYYSDGFPHIDLHKKVINQKELYIRNFGYFGWNDYNSCLSVWLDRFKKAWDKCQRLMETQNVYENSYANLHLEITKVSNTLVELTKDDETFRVHSLVVDEFTRQVSIMKDDGETIAFSRLPAGYFRLLGMGIDMAYRSFILNGDTEPEGIIIIDEVDLHLHPSLECTILHKLRRTFPKVQFIVSTHSPLVISNLNTSDGTAAVLLMSRGASAPKVLPNMYGVDYNATIKDAMDTTDQSPDIDFLVSSYKAYIQLDMMSEAAEIAQTLKKILGAENKIVKELNI